LALRPDTVNDQQDKYTIYCLPLTAHFLKIFPNRTMSFLGSIGSVLALATAPLLIAAVVSTKLITAVPILWKMKQEENEDEPKGVVIPIDTKKMAEFRGQYRVHI